MCFSKAITRKKLDTKLCFIYQCYALTMCGMANKNLHFRKFQFSVFRTRRAVDHSSDSVISRDLTVIFKLNNELVSTKLSMHIQI